MTNIITSVKVLLKLRKTPDAQIIQVRGRQPHGFFDSNYLFLTCNLGCFKDCFPSLESLTRRSVVDGGPRHETSSSDEISASKGSVIGSISV